jgi:hypothetical protein
MHYRWLLLTALLPATGAGCGGVTCGSGTSARTTKDGTTECVPTNVGTAGKCDPATTLEMSGICVADPSKATKCGPGTKLDMMSNTCLPTGGTGPVLKPCPHAANKFSVNGIISHLKDGAFATGEVVEVRVYDPLAFLADPKGTMPQKTVMTMDSTYCFTDLVDSGGAGLIAVAVTDPGGPTNWLLAGVGAQNVAPGNDFRADAYIVEKTLVAGWDLQAGLAADAFESSGAYVGIFVDKPVGMDDGAKPVADVVLQMGAGDAPDSYFFKDSFNTIDKAQKATDGMTGGVVQKVSSPNPTNYSGRGGVVNAMPAAWETVLGASTAGVVFVQKFHVK